MPNLSVSTFQKAALAANNSNQRLIVKGTSVKAKVGHYRVAKTNIKSVSKFKEVVANHYDGVGSLKTLKGAEISLWATAHAGLTGSESWNGTVALTSGKVLSALRMAELGKFAKNLPSPSPKNEFADFLGRIAHRSIKGNPLDALQSFRNIINSAGLGDSDKHRLNNLANQVWWTATEAGLGGMNKGSLTDMVRHPAFESLGAEEKTQIATAYAKVATKLEVVTSSCFRHLDGKTQNAYLKDVRDAHGNGELSKQDCKALDVHFVSLCRQSGADKLAADWALSHALDTTKAELKEPITEFGNLRDLHQAIDSQLDYTDARLLKDLASNTVWNTISPGLDSLEKGEVKGLVDDPAFRALPHAVQKKVAHAYQDVASSLEVAQSSCFGRLDSDTKQQVLEKIKDDHDQGKLSTQDYKSLDIDFIAFANANNVTSVADARQIAEHLDASVDDLLDGNVDLGNLTIRQLKDTKETLKSPELLQCLDTAIAGKVVGVKIESLDDLAGLQQLSKLSPGNLAKLVRTCVQYQHTKTADAILDALQEKMKNIGDDDSATRHPVYDALMKVSDLSPATKKFCDQLIKKPLAEFQTALLSIAKLPTGKKFQAAWEQKRDEIGSKLDGFFKTITSEQFPAAKFGESFEFFDKHFPNEAAKVRTELKAVKDQLLQIGDQSAQSGTPDYLAAFIGQFLND